MVSAGTQSQPEDSRPVIVIRNQVRPPPPTCTLLTSPPTPPIPLNCMLLCPHCLPVSLSEAGKCPPLGKFVSRPLVCSSFHVSLQPLYVVGREVPSQHQALGQAGAAGKTLTCFRRMRCSCTLYSLVFLPIVVLFVPLYPPLSTPLPLFPPCVAGWQHASTGEERSRGTLCLHCCLQ